MAAKMKTKHYYSAHNIATSVSFGMHVSISARQQSLQCGQNLHGPFVRATLPITVGSCAGAMAGNGRQGFITPPSK